MSARAKDMPLQGHLIELRSRTVRAVFAIIIVTLFSATFGIHSIEFNGYVFYYPFPDPVNNLSVQTTYFMRDTLLPSDVQLIQTAPGQAFFAQIYVSLLIGIIGSIPVITKEIFGFISPAFDLKPKKKIVWIARFLPMIVLFAVGAIFSYVLVIPFVLRIPL